MNNELPTGRPKMKADNQMKNPEDVSVLRSEYGNLPPELKAMQTMMDTIFPEEASAAPDDEPYNCQVEGKPCDRWCGANPCLGAIAAPDFAPRRTDIENAIMRAPGFDYLLASEIFAALQRRLELRYENLNPQVEEAMQRLAKSFDHVTG